MPVFASGPGCGDQCKERVPAQLHSAMQRHADATPQRPVRFCGAHLSVSACRSACRLSTAASSEGPSVGGARSTAAIVDSAAPKRADASSQWQYWLLAERAKTHGRVRHAHRYARAANANIGGSSAQGGGVTNTPVKVQLSSTRGPATQWARTRGRVRTCATRGRPRRGPPTPPCAHITSCRAQSIAATHALSTYPTLRRAALD
jgi:hypothetical protein